MDLIATLSTQLGIDAEKAQGLAGGALGALQKQVVEKLGGADASAFAAQIPELAGWKAKAEALTGGSGGALGGAGGLLGAASSLLGGGGGFDLASLVQLAAKSGVSAGAAQKLLPLLVHFLRAKLSPGLVDKVLAAVPALGKVDDEGAVLTALGAIL